MTQNQFDLQILDLHWIKNEDDPTDLCAHGHVSVRIANEIVANKDSLDIALSSTALYLMRTIEIDYKKGDFGSQLLPCCGHFFIAGGETDIVTILGCPNGIDWTIIHTDKDTIKHISENGQEASIDKESYKKLILKFVDQVETFYKESTTKTIPSDEFDKNGYLAFWKEWKLLRSRLN